MIAPCDPKTGPWVGQYELPAAAIPVGLSKEELTMKCVINRTTALACATRALLATSLMLAGCDAGDDGASEAVDDDRGTSRSIMHCKTAAGVGDGSTKLVYETADFMGTDEFVSVHVTRERPGGSDDYGSIKLAADPSGRAWAAPNKMKMTLVSKSDQQASIEVEHAVNGAGKPGVVAKSSNGFCTFRAGPKCGEGERVVCGQGTCACQPLAEGNGISLFSQCTTATQFKDDANETVRFTYTTRPFTLLDQVVAVEVKRTVGDGPSQNFGTVLLAETTVGSWARGNMFVKFARKASGDPSIRVTHYPDGEANRKFVASEQGGWCSHQARPACGVNQTYMCSGGSCGCSDIADSYAESIIAVYDPMFTPLIVGGVVSQALPIPFDEVPAAAVVFGSTVILVSLAYTSGAPFMESLDAIAKMLGGHLDRFGSGGELEDYYANGGALGAVTDIIRPVPDHDNTNWPSGREAQGNTLVEATNEAVEAARDTYQCRDENQKKKYEVENAWSTARGAILTAGNRGRPVHDLVYNYVRALEDLAASADPACEGFESELLKGLRNALCKFYAILRPIQPKDPTSKLAIAKKFIETYFGKIGYTCN